MPRIIFKCPYLKGGSPAVMAHLKNLVGYIATRDGAEKIDPGNTRLAATNKQKELVAQLVQSFPESTELFEYEDYLSAPNRGNASAFITMVIEQNLSQLIHREKYLEYIAKRPRAQRFGTHGLFTGDRDSLVLSQVAEAVAEHPGNVWLPIISLRREDASRLGYDSAENWRSFLSSYAIQMAEAMKIPWEQFRWYADEGISGLEARNRDDFNRMMADCREGKIDRVLCKSISRFARNTQEYIQFVRELLRLGISIHFEKENIDTGKMTSEQVAQIYGAFAQMESTNHSSNMRFSVRMRMEKGLFVPSSVPYGYRLAGRDLEIIPEEAEVVRRIFSAYLSGQGKDDIARELNQLGVDRGRNREKWHPSMQTINLKQYYPFCKEDIFVEVSDEIVEAFLLDKRAEAARDRKMFRYKAFYSLDCNDGIENAAIGWAQPSPEDHLIEKEELAEYEELIRRLYEAISSLPPMQARRVHARYMLGMKVKDIAAMEGITPSQAGKSIHAALRRLRRYFARQKWTVNL